MQDRTRGLPRVHPESVREANQTEGATEEQGLLVTVPDQATLERARLNAPSPEVYRQAVKVILATPELEGRLNYITGSMIASIFGGWLAFNVVTSRTFLFLVDITLFIFSLAAAGLLVGVMIGEGILPPQVVLVLLFVAVGILLLIVGFVFANLIRGTTRKPRQAPQDTSRSRALFVPARGQSRYQTHGAPWYESPNSKRR